VEDHSKTKYFDPLRMTEVWMERCIDILYVKLQKVKEVPEWGEASPGKLKVFL
jgi:hypothetical protein